MKWIKVSDKLPPINESLAIIAEGICQKTMKQYFTMVGSWTSGKGWELTGESYLSVWELTPVYWTSLPPYPQLSKQTKDK